MQSSSQVMFSVLEILQVRPPKKQGPVPGNYVNFSTKDGARFNVFCPADIDIKPGYDGLLLCSCSIVDYRNPFRDQHQPALLPTEVIQWKSGNRVVHSLNLFSDFMKK